MSYSDEIPGTNTKRVESIGDWRQTQIDRITRLQKAAIKAISDLEAQKEALRAPQDVYTDGDVIMYDKAYRRRSEAGQPGWVGQNPSSVYTFVALKINGHWYSSSTMQTVKRTWAELMRKGSSIDGPQNIRLIHSEQPAF